MTSPGASPRREKAHEHIDLGALMDGSARGPDEPRPEADTEESTGEAEYGRAADLSGEVSGDYVSGQDEGSID